MNPVLIVRRQWKYADIKAADNHDKVRCGRSCWMWCPGCDHAVCIPIVGEDGSVPDGPTWEWDGNLEAPTFSPSILQHTGGRIPRCHSFVRGGQWQFLADCEHALAGRTADMVPLPAWLVRE